MTHDPARPAVHRLPLASWAARFRAGTAEIRGRLPAPLQVPDGDWRVPAGPARLTMTFSGGARPAVNSAHLEGHPGPTGPGLVTAALAALHDVSVVVTADLAEALVLPLSAGLVATVEGGTQIRLRAQTNGSPPAPRLSDPLVIEVGGEGMHLGVPAIDRWPLTAGLHIHHLSLAPDGEVALACAADGRLTRLVNGALRPVARQLTELVRHSPRLAEVRLWLDAPP